MAYQYPNQQPAGSPYNPSSGYPGGPAGGYNPATGGYNPGQTAYIPGNQRDGSTGYYGMPPQGPTPAQSAWSNQPQGAPAGVDPSIYHWFLAVDQDRSGRISSRELKQALLNGNWTTFSEDACRMMITLFDRNKHGSIDLNEFQSLWNYIQQWRGVFERYDADRSGFIEQAELQRAISEMGYRLTPQFFASIIAKYDPKQKRKMSLDDFIIFCVQMQLFTNSFRERDTGRTGTITINYEDFLACIFLTKP